MAKPATLPRWAETAGGSAAANIVAPASGKQDTGYVTGGDIPTSGSTNWLLRWLYKWAQYLDGLTGEALTWTARATFNGGCTVPASTPASSDAARRSEVDAGDSANAAAITAETTARTNGDAATLASANAHSDAIGFVASARIRGSDGAILSQAGRVTISSPAREAAGYYTMTIPGLTSSAIMVATINYNFAGLIQADSTGANTGRVEVWTPVGGSFDADFSIFVVNL
jgi:hypothetical protein